MRGQRSFWSILASPAEDGILGHSATVSKFRDRAALAFPPVTPSSERVVSTRDRKDADESRRLLLRLLSASGAASLAGLDAFAAPRPAPRAAAPLQRKIPSSGEAIPAIGIGSWITFNVGDDPAARRR